MAPATAAPAESAFLEKADALKTLGIGESKYWELIAAGEFTVRRDGKGRGHRVYPRRDECEVYAGLNPEYPAGGLDALRRFRRKKGRAK